PVHPFSRQVKYKAGYNFDNADIVPKTTQKSLTNYFIPLGHSLSYGIDTAVIRKNVPEGDPRNTPSYMTSFQFKAGQTVNFLEFSEAPGRRVPFSRAFASLLVANSSATWTTDYFFYPYLSRLRPDIPAEERSPHEVTTRLTYTLE